jgi:hypothetical protein
MNFHATADTRPLATKPIMFKFPGGWTDNTLDKYNQKIFTDMSSNMNVSPLEFSPFV